MRKSTSPGFALAVLAGISTIGFVDRIVVNVLVEPVKQEFGLSDTQVSLMGLAFVVLYLGVGLVIARLAERVRRLSLISIGALVWSATTAICGIASSWPQLLLARIGVGFGEAVGLPAVQSVIADYFPPSKRGLAMSVQMLAPPLGAFIGFVGGGWIAQEFGWRFTFLVAALPAAILALIAWLFVAEPVRGGHDAVADDSVPPFMAVVARIFGLASCRNLLFGSAIAAMLGFGVNYFFASLMIRRFDVGLGEAGLYTGLIASLPAALSVLGSGWLADRYGERNPATYALIPGLCMAIGGPLYAFAITREDLAPLLVLVSVSTVLNFGYLGITFAAIQNLMHPRMRATASALLGVFYGLASAFGPMLFGFLSDTLAPDYGDARGLAYAMAIGGLIYLWAALHYLLAARKLRADLVKVGAAIN